MHREKPRTQLTTKEAAAAGVKFEQLSCSGIERQDVLYGAACRDVKDVSLVRHSCTGLLAARYQIPRTCG